MKPCERCGVITVEQETGAYAGAETLAILATFHRDGASGNTLFGTNLMRRKCDVCPAIRVGDAITVV